MASGVSVADNVTAIYTEMKLRKNDDDENERIRIAMFSLTNNCIDVEENNILREKDLKGQDAFEAFVNLLDNQKCCYLLYDCHYETNESPKEELVFMMWSPDTASIKTKMYYASSIKYLRKTFSGIKYMLEVHDLGDVNTRGSFAKCLGKNMTKLEGRAVTGDC